MFCGCVASRRALNGEGGAAKRGIYNLRFFLCNVCRVFAKCVLRLTHTTREAQLSSQRERSVGRSFEPWADAIQKSPDRDEDDNSSLLPSQSALSVRQRSNISLAFIARPCIQPKAQQ